jgi:hypothetical protein
VARKTLRRLVADGQLYLYTTGWTYDLDGERVVSVALFHSEVGREQHPRGKPMRAHFLAREAEYPAASVAAKPADVRAVLDQALALGWDGRREGWLLPACGLERPNLVLSTKTRLKGWAADAPIFAAHIEEAAIAERLATALAVPPVPGARGAAEAQWQDDRRYILRSRWGTFVHVYTRSVAELVHVLATLHRRAPQLGASVAAIPAQEVLHGFPPDQVVPPEHWATQPDATRHHGVRPTDRLWSFTTPDGPAIESYEFDREVPDRLQRWTSLRDAGSVERRSLAPVPVTPLPS